MLFSNHITSLGARAISHAAAQAAGISSATPPEVASILGLANAQTGGMLIPYIGADGQPVQADDGADYCRVRMDDGTPKYQSRGGAGFASVYLPPLLRNEISHCVMGDRPMFGGDFILITEGELKALSVEQNLGIPSVGLPGVTMFRDPARDKSEPATKSTPLHPHLAAVIARASGVVVVADSDASSNSQVRNAMMALRDSIAEQFKIPCAYVEVPGTQKKKGRPTKEESDKVEKLGIDDWIAKEGAVGMDSITAHLRKAFYAARYRAEAMATGGIIPLGIKIDQQSGSGQSIVYSIQKRAIISVKSSDLTNPSILIHALGGDYARAAYPKKDKEGKVVGFDSLQAGMDLDAACTAAGYWDETRKVASGVWPLVGDRNTIVINSASGVWNSEGVAMERVDTISGKVFMTDRDLGVTPGDAQATTQQVQEIAKALATFSWIDDRDAGMALAWLAAAVYCGGLEHRPMLYVTGKLGSGKSEVLNFMRTMLGRLALDKFEGTVLTEAGLRKSLAGSSLVTLIDEAEATARDPNRMSSLMDYIRSSYAGGRATKGRSNGGGVDEFTIRTMTALCAINPPAMEDAEKSRFIRLFMHPRDGMATSHPMIKSDPEMAAEYGSLFVSRMLHNFARFRRTLDIVHPLIGDVSQRCIDTLGTVVAAGFVATNDSEPTEAALIGYMSTLDIDSQRERITGRTDSTPLEWLLDLVVATDIAGRMCRLSVREMAIQAFSECGTRVQPYAQALGRLGMRITADTDGHPALYVDPRNEELTRTYASSKWSGQAIGDMYQTHVPTCGKKLSDPMTIGGKKVRPLEISCIDKMIDLFPEPIVVTRRRTATDDIDRVYDSSANTH
ncbi:DUF3854 domain-containing protein [Rhodoferax sp. PAMC 29310]|uniref:DUF3854 domain-containing protein n=1 Tax=Rhodoferax sp. PAMC 29310 TaxID=2822760 RepID=UPI001B32BE09|nr:DUF3854 domain-containing protein [Rhodoferax sp. PAMC 29310]